MKIRIGFILILILIIAAISSFAETTAGNNALRRFALVIGCNDGGKSRTKLQYAADDAVSFVRVMRELGALDERDLVLLTDPSASEIREGFRSIKLKAATAQANSGRKELLLYFSGHSDEEGILPMGDKISYSDIRSWIAGIDVNVRVAILDSCASGAFTRAKGVIKRPAFLVDSSSETKGYAFITSSAEDEVAQESDRIKGSFFTHYLVSGLRGAADSTNDGVVTLNEAYSYAFRETLARTEKTQYGAQHAKYDIQLTGTGDLVLTDLREAVCGLVIADDLEGKFFVRDSSGNLIAEIGKLSGKPVELGMEPGTYDISVEMKGSMYEARAVLSKNKYVTLSRESFAKTDREKARPRGNDETIGEEEPDPGSLNGIFHFTLIPFVGLETKTEESVISAGLLVDDSNRVNGFQVSSIGNLANRVYGCELASVFNASSEEIDGAQIAGVVNIGAVVNGAQVSGVVNVSGSVNGAQIGTVNCASKVTGFQVGVVNIADDFEIGIPIGLVNIVKNGTLCFDTLYDDAGYVRFDFRSGTKMFYSILTAGFVPNTTPIKWQYGAGFGFNVQLGPFYAATNATMNAYQEGTASFARTPFSLRPDLSFEGGFTIGRFGVFGGVSFGVEIPGWYREESPLTAFSIPLYPIGDLRIVPHYFIGLRF
jgi:hypothetical protein